MSLVGLKFERVNPDSPDRCQALGGAGQCPFKKLPNTEYCPRHQGAGKSDKESRRKYNVAKWMDQIDYNANNPEIKELNEDIGLMRMLISARLEQCNDSLELSMNSGAISALLDKVAVLVEKWHRIQMQTNAVMDRHQALEFVQSLGEIIYKNISDYPDASDRIKKISDEMISDLQMRTGTGLKALPTKQ